MQLTVNRSEDALQSFNARGRDRFVSIRNSASTSMDRLPVETLQPIFTLACTDGGYTGNSLSLTSKYIRAASRIARFHSISLIASPRRLQSFVALYERECDAALGDKPRLRHLHITFPRIGDREISYGRPLSRSPDRGSSDRRTGEENAGSTGHSFSSRSSPRSFNGSVLDDLEQAPQVIRGDDLSDDTDTRTRRSRKSPPDPTTSPEYLGAARTLFSLAAPDLHTLAVQSGFSIGGGLYLPILQAPFVALRELTLIDIPRADDLFANPTMGSPIFPAATRLHILFETVYTRNIQISTWAVQAPRVTHLRISGATGRCQPELALAVGVAPEHDPLPDHPSVLWAAWHHLIAPPRSPSPPPPPTYPSLRHLIVLPCPRPRPGFCGTPMVEHAEMVDALQGMARTIRQAGVQVVALEPGQYPRRVSRRLARRAHGEWLDRIVGAAGCWEPLHSSPLEHGGEPAETDKE